VSPRSPSPALVVDSNIILSVAFGLRSRSIFKQVATSRGLLTSARAREEVLGTAAHVGGAEAVEIAAPLLDAMTVVDADLYEGHLAAASAVLRHAVASRNGSMKDAHILALAWAFDADIWSHDRDFAGTGWPSWSNANLRASLEREAPPAP